MHRLAFDEHIGVATISTCSDFRPTADARIAYELFPRHNPVRSRPYAPAIGRSSRSFKLGIGRAVGHAARRGDAARAELLINAWRVSSLALVGTMPCGSSSHLPPARTRPRSVLWGAGVGGFMADGVVSQERHTEPVGWVGGP